MAPSAGTGHAAKEQGLDGCKGPRGETLGRSCVTEEEDAAIGTEVAGYELGEPGVGPVSAAGIVRAERRKLAVFAYGAAFVAGIL